MAKVKSVRSQANDYNTYWSEYREWLKENNTTSVDTNQVAIAKYAETEGISNEEASAILIARYHDQRNAWDKEFTSRQIGREQELKIRNNSLDSACAVYQRADRILSNIPVTVFLNDVANDPTPAWNDGKNITFNAKSIKSLDSETVTSLHGLNYHELGHLLFTPRSGTDLGKWVNETVTTQITPQPEMFPDYHYEQTNLVDSNRPTAFNILEDCRAENLLALRYPAVRPFLTATIADYILGSEGALENSFILLGGRKYLPIELRKLSARQYAEKNGEEQTERVYNILSEYRRLVFPRDYARAKELITEVADLMRNNNLSIPQTPNGCSSRELMKNGRPMSAKEQEQVAKLDKPDAGDNPLDSLGGTGDEGSEGAEHYNPDFNEKSAEVVEALRRATETAKSDKSVTEKARDTLRAINKDSSFKSILTASTPQTVEPTLKDVATSRAFGQELERIRIDSDPAWLTELPTGKLNVRRAMNADVNDIGKLFDRWETGNDDYDIEASVLIDRSGSMWTDIGSACRSAWIIKRGIEKIDGKVTLISFNDESRIVSPREDRAKPNKIALVPSTGGTEPYYGVLETERIMEQSSAKTKLVFLLTDGGFSGKSDEIIARMRKQGVYVALVFLGNEHWTNVIAENPDQYRHGANDLTVIGNPLDLVKVAKNVVRHTIKAGASAHR